MDCTALSCLPTLSRYPTTCFLLQARGVPAVAAQPLARTAASGRHQWPPAPPPPAAAAPAAAAAAAARSLPPATPPPRPGAAAQPGAAPCTAELASPHPKCILAAHPAAASRTACGGHGACDGEVGGVRHDQAEARCSQFRAVRKQPLAGSLLSLPQSQPCRQSGWNEAPPRQAVRLGCGPSTTLSHSPPRVHKVGPHVLLVQLQRRAQLLAEQARHLRAASMLQASTATEQLPCSRTAAGVHVLHAAITSQGLHGIAPHTDAPRGAGEPRGPGCCGPSLRVTEG